MNKLIFISFLFCFSLITLCQKSNLKAYIDVKEFYDLKSGNYAEIELQFAIQSTSLKTIGDTALQASVAVFIDILSEDKVVTTDAYRLNSPLYQIKDSLIEDFYEIKRYALNPGSYQLKIRITDLNAADSTNQVSGIENFEITTMKDKISISDILTAEYAIKSETQNIFQRSGLLLVPLFSNFYAPQSLRIISYCEFYNTHLHQDSTLGLMYQIINSKTDEEVKDFTSLKRFKASPFEARLKALDIEFLPSGSYILQVSIVDRNVNVIASKSYAFERVNEITTSLTTETVILDPAFQGSLIEDSVAYYLESLIPISKPAEVKNIISTLKKKDNDRCRKHIQAFWIKTSPQNPYESWMQYKTQVDFVEKVYANNFQEGFETDRGRVYLQYGSPSSMVSREASPSDYPYEIWTYDKIGVFSNKRFVFYNPELVNRAYRLLHSDMIGELKNNAWPQILSKRNTIDGNIDNPNSYNIDHWGGNSNDLFRQY